MTNVFLISDTHFGHTNIIKYCDRPFANADEMDQALIENWNSVVSKNDKVYHLGDVTMSTKKLPLLEQLNGTKVLIRGNHDIFKLKEYVPYFKDLRGSHEIANLLLTHIPVSDTQKYRYRGNVHGHTHEKNLPDPWYTNVSVEQIDYRPIALEEILKLYN